MSEKIKKLEMIIQELFNNDEIKKEYRKTFLLCMFQKICSKMQTDKDFNIKIRKLFLQSFDSKNTVKLIIKDFLKYEISTDDAILMETWFKANFNKLDSRKKGPFIMKVKKDLYKKQNGKCMLCGENLGDDWSKIHVDHIIPFKLVGDELTNNYQDLCDICNSTKSARTDFIFKRMLKLI